ncbi:MAG: tRNA (adenosine(37)-N6)-threonylcarbamoyltransferase complex transferase subunit TsaD [Pseudomonadota bacterium]|nr:tRNA (adenosine(37)-N6)-threonylcarbamoyltransferase complex transferase subunit TsaD [Pseudomonadota bacterium]
MTAKPLTVLGLETSCDETAAAVVRLAGGARPDILSNVVLSQIDAHIPYGGVVPEIAARAHVESIDAIARQALAEAGVAAQDLDGVAATAGPGLVGGVMVGLSFGKAMALALGLPLIAVNHLEGHAVSARLTAEVPYPFLLLLVSGGHCQLLEVAGVGACRRLGTTIDDAAGEAFDKIGGALGLAYPAGPALERLAEGGDAARFPLPRALAGRKGCDFSFSGLKTAAARLAAGLTTDEDRRDLAAAVQGAIARQLVERTARAMRTYAAARNTSDTLSSPSGGSTAEGRDGGSPPRGIGESPHRRFAPLPPVGEERRVAGLRFVVAGGVAANRTVRGALESLAAAEGFSFDAPPLAYCTDNAAMIALAGAERLALGLTDDLDAVARPRWPLDEVAARLHPTHLAGRKGAKS